MPRKPEAVDVTMAEVTKNMLINIRLRGRKCWSLRLWIGLRLLRFACWVIPIDTFIDLYGGEEDSDG